MVNEGRLLPAERAKVVAFMEGLPDAAVVVEFGDANAKTETPALKVYQDFLAGLPPRVEFGEIAKSGATADTVDLADVQAIADAALKHQREQAAAGIEIGIDAAVAHVVHSNQAR